MDRLTLFDPVVWETFVKPGEILEIRIIKATGKFPFTGEHVRGTTVAGYFDNHGEFCRQTETVLKSLGYDGGFFSLQVIDRRLLARAFNRLKISSLATSDLNVTDYRWLPVDLDPVRPAGVSSSDSELQEALKVRDEVSGWVIDNLGLTTPIRAMSGNGGHLLFRLPDLPVSDESKAFLKNTLEAIARRFNTDRVKIDTTVFNPARIWKLYGTTAHKGDPLPAGPYREARPHRQSYIEDLGDL